MTLARFVRKNVYRNKLRFWLTLSKLLRAIHYLGYALFGGKVSRIASKKAGTPAHGQKLRAKSSCFGYFGNSQYRRLRTYDLDERFSSAEHNSNRTLRQAKDVGKNRPFRNHKPARAVSIGDRS